MSTGKLIIILVIVLLILVGLVGLAAKIFFGGFTRTTLTYWGLWEPEVVYTAVIANYQQKHPNVKINYKKQSPLQYRERLQAALAQGTGPDIFRFHNTWLPMFKNDLSPVPENIYSPSAFRQTFYPVAVKDLSAGGKFYGLPLEIDTLALYANQDLLSKAGVAIPTAWPMEFADAAKKLKVENNGRLVIGGAGLGNAGNVTHWPDILALMMLQNGADLTNPVGQLAEDALSFYTGFQTIDQVWDETQDESKLAFAKGNLALFFGYHWDSFDIKNINPNLNFKIAPVPQLAGSNVNYASYWAEGVAKKSKNQPAAWDFLKFISQKDQLAKLYEVQSRLRGFGEPYGRMDMADLLQSDPVVSVFINQAKTAQSFYLASLTWDGTTGLNSRIGNYFADAVNANKNGGDAKSALATAARGVSQVLSTYGLQISP